MFRRVVAILSSCFFVTCSLPRDARALKQDTTTVIRQQYGNFKEECFPRPSGGCNCNIKDSSGVPTVKKYNTDAECRVPVEEKTKDNKKKLNEEIKEKFGNFKENCFPKPSGGCRCNEKDAQGNDVEAKYDSDADCRIPLRTKRATTQRPSQNVRDPVRERAQANYAAVLKELNDKFKGLKEGCFPRPKGCLCIIGKDRDGRDITERRMQDKDCKCQPGERSRECPAPAA